MDFIKKHFEKLLLATGLLVLIGCAAFLAYRVTKLSEEIQDAPQRSLRKTKATVVPTATGTYSNAIAGLQSPALWQANAVDPFQTQLKWVPPVELPPTNVLGPRVELLRIIRQPFKLMFQSYRQPDKDFAVNFITRNRTFFIAAVGKEVGDAFEKTGFFITKFDRKEIEVYNKSLNRTNLVDVSELTIEKPGTPPIVLTLGKIAQEREPIAVLLCNSDNREARLRRGDEFNCGGKTYKVIDINPTQVLIEETESKDRHTIGLPDVKE